MRCLIPAAAALAALSASGISRAEDAPGASYVTAAPAVSAPAAPGSVTAPVPGPVLRLPGTDWAAASAAEGVVKDGDLAGSPDAPLPGKPRLAAADQDSYFNTEDWKNASTPKAVRGRASTLKQLAGAGEGMSLNMAADAVTKLIDGK